MIGFGDNYGDVHSVDITDPENPNEPIKILDSCTWLFDFETGKIKNLENRV